MKWLVTVRSEVLPMKHLYLLGVAALVAAAPVQAQRPDSTMRRHAMKADTGWHRAPGMMMGPMMMGSPWSPQRLLAQNGGLKLTAQQITALTSLRDAESVEVKTEMDKAQMHGKELKAALDAGTDTAAVRMHFTAAHQAMGEAQLARMIAGVRARALLTDAQRKQVEDASARMRKGMMGRRGGAMMWRGRRMPPGKPMAPPPPAANGSGN